MDLSSVWVPLLPAEVKKVIATVESEVGGGFQL